MYTLALGVPASCFEESYFYVFVQLLLSLAADQEVMLCSSVIGWVMT